MTHAPRRPYTLVISSSLDAGSKDLGTVAPGTPATATSTLTVQTFGAPGYTVSASISSQLTDGSNFVPATTSGTLASPGSWSGNGFGYSIVSATGLDPKWGAGTNYAPFATTPESIHTTGAAFTPNTANTTTTVIGYRLVAPPSQVPGTYSATVTLIAAPTA